MLDVLMLWAKTYPISQDYGAIVLCDMKGSVTRRGVVIRPGAQHSKLLFDVAVEREDDRNGRHQDVADK
jgi:hypothetical protein